MGFTHSVPAVAFCLILWQLPGVFHYWVKACISDGLSLSTFPKPNPSANMLMGPLNMWCPIVCEVVPWAERNSIICSRLCLWKRDCGHRNESSGATLPTAGAWCHPPCWYLVDYTVTGQSFIHLHSLIFFTSQPPWAQTVWEDDP